MTYQELKQNEAIRVYITRADAALSAAGSSYVSAPITLIRIHGRGMPRNLESVITPSKIEIAGAIVNIDVEKITLRSFCALIPSCFPLRYARTRKNADCASTKIITQTAIIYRNVLLTLNSIKGTSLSLMISGMLTCQF